MFPYSPIPEEPATNPIREGYKSKLNARDYNAGETELFVSVYEVLICDWFGGERERVHVCSMCASCVCVCYKVYLILECYSW